MWKTYIKKLLIFAMIFFVVSNSFLGSLGNIEQNVVYAEDENNNNNDENDEENNDDDSEEEDGEDEVDKAVEHLSKDGNLAGLGSSKGAKAVTDVLKDAAGYDIRMQYLVTYSFLSDEYGVGDSQSRYQNLFDGGDETTSDMEDVGTESGMDLETDPEVIVGEISGKDTGDPHEDHEKSGNSDEYDKKKEELAEKLGEKQSENVASTLGTSDESKDEIINNRNDSSEGYLGLQLDHYIEGHKRFRTDQDASDEIKEKIKKSYAKDFMSGIKNIDADDLESEEDLIKNIDNELGVLKGPLQTYLEDYREDKIESGINKIQEPSAQSNNIVMFGNDSEYKADEDGYVLMPFSKDHINDWDSYRDYGYNVKLQKNNGQDFTEEEAKVLIDIFPEYLYVTSLNNGEDNGIVSESKKDLESRDGKKSKDEEVVTNLSREAAKDTEKDLKKYYAEELNDFLKNDDEASKLFEEIKEMSEEEEESLEESLEDEDGEKIDGSILSWMILYPTFEDIGGRGKEEFGDEVEKETDYEFKDDVLYKKDDEDRDEVRPVLIKDLMFSSESENILTYDSEDEFKVNAKVGKKDDQKLDSKVKLGRYTGFKPNKFLNIFDSTDRDNKHESNINVAISKYLFAHNKDGKDTYNNDLDAESNDIIGTDSYGNIIDSTTGTIIVPYWQNSTIKRMDLDKDNAWVSHSIYKHENNGEVAKVIEKELEDIRENGVEKDDIIEAFSDEGIEGDNIEKFVNDFEDVSLEKDMDNFEETLSDEDAVKLLALKITAGTHKEVKSWNESFIDSGMSGKELFVKSDMGRDINEGGDGKSKDEEKMEEYTEADLIERIMMLLDYGFYDVLRLTLASLVVDIYNSTFFHYKMSSVFHTTTLTDMEDWEDLMSIISTTFIFLIGLYVLFMTILWFMQRRKFSDIVKQFIIVTLIILVPTVLYGPIIDFTINKPTDFFLSKQTDQMMILDTQVDFQDKQDDDEDEEDEVYNLLFNGNKETRDKVQDYVIKFNTTTHKNGYDIEEATEEDLNFVDNIKLEEAENSGDWSKKELESIGVSVFDVFEWLNKKVDEEETDMDLFDWLSTEKESTYEDVGGYEEASYNPNGEYSNVKDSFLEDEVSDYDKITASQLLEKIYEASSSKADGGKNLSERIQNMENIASTVKKRDSDEKLDKEEFEAIMRDFSLSRQGRETSFGNEKIDNDKVVKQNEDTPNVSNKTIQAWDRIGDGKLLIPENDYLNIEPIMDDLNPSIGDSREKNNDKVVYEVNNNVLNNYVNSQSMVRETVGADVGEAEFMAITMSEFFEINKVLGIDMFPDKVEHDSVSLDTFARMIYIPLHEYKDVDTEGLNNLGEYVSYRDNPILLLALFIPAMFLLASWGMIYLAVFSVVLLVVSFFTFLWQYVVKQDYENQSWLGTLIIIGRFALAKIGLLSLWLAMTYIMNYTYSVFGGVTYAYTHIHSLILLVYIIICIKVVFLKTFKQVKDSPGDLGGSVAVEGMKDSFNNMRNKLRRGTTDKEGSASSKKSVEKTLENEGSDKKIGAETLGTITSGINQVMDRFKGRGYGEVDEISESLDPLGSKIERRFPRMLKGVNGKSRREMLKDYDDIGNVDNIDGVGRDTLEGLGESGKIGQVISSNANGTNIAKMAVGNAENASRLVSHLDSRGISSWKDEDNNVFFNAQGRDLANKEVRKSMYGGLVNNMYNEIEDENKVTDREEENIKSYTENSDGSVDLTIGDNGISTSNVDSLINSKKFGESFRLEDKPSKDMKGNYIPGTMKIVPKQGIDKESSVNEMFETDSQMRSDRGEQERGEVNQDRSVSVEGLSNMNSVRKYLKSGMSMQGDKILYDSDNSRHVSAVSKLRNKIEDQTSSNYQDKLDFMTKMTSQVAYGGNKGFKTDLYNTSKDEDVNEIAKTRGLVDDNVTSTVYAGNNALNVENNIKEAKNLSDLGNEDIMSYQNAKDMMYREGETVFLGDNEDYSKGLDKLIKSTKKVGGKGSTKADNVKEDFDSLKKKLDTADITEDEYNNEVEGLFSDLQLDLQDSGEYTEVISKEIRNGKHSQDTKDIFDDFVHAKRNLKESGVSTDLVDKFSGEDMEEITSTMRNIDDVKDNGDGTLDISSESELDRGDIERIVDKMSKKGDD